MMLQPVPRKHALNTQPQRLLVQRQSLDEATAHVKPFKHDSTHNASWSPNSWRTREAKQQPQYPDIAKVDEVFEELSELPPLVFAGECRNLQARLEKVVSGDGFILQGGDCAESFTQRSANALRDTYRILLQMSLILSFGGGVPVVKMGRMAGQFAKPRSANMEKKGESELPSYRGDIINGMDFTEEARVPDPARLVTAYNQSAATLNLLRGFSSGGYASLRRVMDWNLWFMTNSQKGQEYLELAQQVEDALKFMIACGIQPDHPAMKETEFYTAHEALLLHYEEALTRQDSTTGLYYDCSAHFVWVGERTRELDGAHLEFLRGVANPIGCKVSNKMSPEELLELIEILNPDNVPGRLGVVTRMGAANIREHLPKLIEAVEKAGKKVAWICDPVHGNTETVNGLKTRRYDNIYDEVAGFFDVHEQMGTWPGGLHVEMTGDNVTECLGGGSQVGADELHLRYTTQCDPRLNAEQALELAFYAASRLSQRKDRLVMENFQEAKSEEAKQPVA